MTEFEHALQECLLDLEHGGSNMEECLQRHPQFARDLEPILLTGAYLARGHAARLSPAFKTRVRSRLIREMHTHPRKTVQARFMFMRMAASLAVVVIPFLIGGTAYAQRALPGEAFYDWKLASENVWRAVSPDPLEVDLAIAERRMQELMAVREQPALQAQALEAYLEVAYRLRQQANTANEERILSVLDAQAEELNQQGLLPAPPDHDVIPPLTEPTVAPVTTPAPILTTPQVDLTELPQIVPTVDVLPDAPTVESLPNVAPTTVGQPEVVPTVQLPDIVPTLEIPPPLR